MKSIWKYELPEFITDYHFYYDGRFFANSQYIIFIYREYAGVILIKFDYEGKCILKYEFDVKGEIPSLWQTVVVEGITYLILDDHTVINIWEHTIINCDASTMGAKKDWLGKSRYLEEGPFSFEDFYIEHPTSSTFICKDKTTKSIKWKAVLKGYLYSKIFEYDNYLIFCTAGRGGGVYALDSEAGNEKYFIDTKGTQKHEIVKGNMFFYLLGKKGMIVKMNMKTGEFIESSSLHEVTLDSPLKYCIDRFLLTLSFVNGKQEHHIPVIECFDLLG